MKRTILALMLSGLALAPVWSDGQFRITGGVATPIQTLPSGGPEEWHLAVAPNQFSMNGWHWEVIFDHLGLGMHYGMRVYEAAYTDAVATDWYLDWKGDFFLSYHLLGGGSVLDPFVEFGWGNVGSTAVAAPGCVEYPDWENEVRRGDAVALGFFNYYAVGVAADINGLLLGGKLSYIPSELSRPIPDSSIEQYRLDPFEVSFFAGLALGGHDRHHRGRGRD